MLVLMMKPSSFGLWAVSLDVPPMIEKIDEPNGRKKRRVDWARNDNFQLTGYQP